MLIIVSRLIAFFAYFFLLKKKILFYFWLCGVFIAAWVFSLVVHGLLTVVAFSCCRAQALGQGLQ